MKNKKSWSIKQIFLISVSAMGLFLFILFSAACYFIVKSNVQSEFKHRLNYYQNLYLDSVTNDILVGRDHETYRKCKSLFKDKEIYFIEIKRPKGDMICRLIKNGFDKEELLFINSSIFFGESKKNVAATLKVGYSIYFLKNLIFKIIGLLFAVFIFLLILQIIFLKVVGQKVSRPVAYIVQQFETGGFENFDVSKKYHDSSIVEIKKLFNGLKDIISKLKKYQSDLVNNTKLKAFSQIATQVVHDVLLLQR